MQTITVLLYQKQTNTAHTCIKETLKWKKNRESKVKNGMRKKYKTNKVEISRVR
jgi:hypothetical protein